MSNTHFTPNGAANHAADATKPAATAVTESRVFSIARHAAVASWKPALFAVLMWVAAAAGEIPIPGTPVPITLQTFVVMLAGLMLTWRQAGSAVAAYLVAGAAGLPVFAGGASTMALVGPSAGFLLGFLPGVVVIALLRGRGKANRAPIVSAHRASADHGAFKAAIPATIPMAALTALRYFAAAIVGGVAVVYAFGFLVQSALTGLPLTAVALASMGFVIGDVVKAAVASLAAAGLARLR